MDGASSIYLFILLKLDGASSIYLSIFLKLDGASSIYLSIFLKLDGDSSIYLSILLKLTELNSSLQDALWRRIFKIIDTIGFQHNRAKHNNFINYKLKRILLTRVADKQSARHSINMFTQLKNPESANRELTQYIINIFKPLNNLKGVLFYIYKF